MNINQKIYAFKGIESKESIEKKLDTILSFAKTFNDRDFNRIQLNDKFRVDGKYPYSLDSLLTHLIEEGFISPPKKLVIYEGTTPITTEHYYLNLKGELFEGYVKTKRNHKITIWAKTANAFAATLATLVLAVGGVHELKILITLVYKWVIILLTKW